MVEIFNVDCNQYVDVVGTAHFTRRSINDAARAFAFVGAAHVEGIKDLLMNPLLIKDQLRKFNLSFTEPTLIRRVAIQWN
jgi:pheromone shutdown protein TraB